MTQTVTDVETILDIDFDMPIPCEHPKHHTEPAHGGPGAYLVRGIPTPCCGFARGLFIVCAQAWEWAGRVGLRCCGCGRRVTRDSAWKFIEAL